MKFTRSGDVSHRFSAKESSLFCDHFAALVTLAVVRSSFSQTQIKLPNAANFRLWKPQKIKARLKEGIKFEFNHCCAYCGSKSKRLSLDHVNAESRSVDSWRNLVPACGKCNLSKGSLNLRVQATAAFYSEERLPDFKQMWHKDLQETVWAKGI